MKPRLLHQEAMTFSFKAKEAFDNGNYSKAQEYYLNAANLESQVAEFYFDKPEYEPTRGVLIRSAAFLNLKAGEIERARRFIYFGLLNLEDPLLREQLNDALELSFSLMYCNPYEASKEFSYLNALRQQSVHYILIPSNPIYGNSVSLAMLKDFSEGYLKSLKAFSLSKLKRISSFKNRIEDLLNDEIDKYITPLITNTSYGSFKFSLANDFTTREGDDIEFTKFKSTIIPNYHNEIFINPLTDHSIEKLKYEYSDDEVNNIYKPLVKLNSVNSPIRIGYYEIDSFKKQFINRIVNKQRKQLITSKKISQADIGELESIITHTRISGEGKVSKKTIFKEQLKTYEADIKLSQIEPKNAPALILVEDILISINFDNNNGFRLSFPDFNIESKSIEYNHALSEFHNMFYAKILHLINKTDLSDEEKREFNLIDQFVANKDKLKV